MRYSEGRRGCHSLTYLSYISFTTLLLCVGIITKAVLEKTEVLTESEKVTLLILLDPLVTSKMEGRLRREMLIPGDPPPLIAPIIGTTWEDHHVSQQIRNQMSPFDEGGIQRLGPSAFPTTRVITLQGLGGSQTLFQTRKYSTETDTKVP